MLAVALIAQLREDTVQPIETADYWPGIYGDEVLPDRNAVREDFAPLNWIGNG